MSHKTLLYKFREDSHGVWRCMRPTGARYGYTNSLLCDFLSSLGFTVDEHASLMLAQNNMYAIEYRYSCKHIVPEISINVIDLRAYDPCSSTRK